MQVEVTIRDGDTCADVALRADRPVRLADFGAELAAALGTRDEVELWHGSRRLPPSTPLGAAGLRTGAVLHARGPAPEPPRPGVLALHRVGGPDAGAGVALTRGRLIIGRDRSCDIVVADPDASRQHAVLEIGTSAITLHDCGSTNGTTLDGARVGVAGTPVTAGQLIRIGDSTLALRGPVDVPASLTDAGDGTRRLLRPPRDAPAVSHREIVLPQRANASRPRGVQWIAALVPALAGGAVAWFTHSPQFLLFALLSPVMLVSTSLGDRLHWRKSRRRDAATYTQRRVVADRQIAEALSRERAARLHAAPDAAAIAATAALPGSRLWERRRTDADLLDVRLGLATCAAALRVRDGPAVSPAGHLAAVPCSVPLRDGPLGVCGPPDVVDAVARQLVGQLAALHSPADMALTLLLGDGACDRWRWARWLPHLDGRVATSLDEWSAHVARLADDTRRSAAVQRGGGWRGPWHVLVIDRAADVAEAAGLRALLADGRQRGVTAVCLAVDEASLPAECATVVRVHGATGTRASVRHTSRGDGHAQPSARSVDAAPVATGSDGGARATDLVLDTVGAVWAETLARDLAPIVDAGVDGVDALPESCGLLATLGLPQPTPELIASRWATCDGGASTPIGVAGDGPLLFDLARDGPHALVAGTTGAGKSELLQTLVAGLAAHHPPESVTFLLVDYKGGAAFGDCARLPHTAGLVTDLDGYLTARALRSLNSELRRRERLFAACGAVDLAAYRAADQDTAVPRLVIVVDEFAALAEELPDFVHGLIGVAQRGRSLGVHLVLATQRPRSAVSAEIRANTALRVALRVTDTTESTDVIDAADAASITRHTPGRGYLRAGESVVCFQSAHAGQALQDGELLEVARLDPWRRPEPVPAGEHGRSELHALVDAMCAAARHTRRAPAVSPWLAPLPAQLPSSQLPEPARRSLVRVAVADLPDEQRRAAVGLDLHDATSLLIAGGPRSGRSTALAQIALDAANRHSPEEVQLYVVDPGGALSSMLATLPHVATLVGHDDARAALRLLHLLSGACAQDTADGRRRVRVLLIDSWDALSAALGDADAGECAELLAGLLRTGPAAGLTVVVAGGRGCLMPRFAGNFASRIVLALPDRNDYGLAGINPRDVPHAMPPGRGVRADDGAVVQLPHPGVRPDVDATRAIAAELAARHVGGAPPPHGADAIRLRPLPRLVTVGQLDAAHTGEAGDAGGRLLWGVGGDGAEPIAIDPFAGAGQLIVAGPPRSGRSTALLALLDRALRVPLPVIVAGGARSPLVAAAARHGIPTIAPQAGPDALRAPPDHGTLVLVDDGELFDDAPVGEALLSWVRAPHHRLAVVVAGRADDLATSYRGLGAQVRRSCCGLLLRPGPIDGEIVGTRLPRRPRSGPPGRGVLVGDPAWGELFVGGEPVPIQIALPDDAQPARGAL